MFEFNSDFVKKMHDGDATEDEILEALRLGTACIIELYDALGRKHSGSAERMPSRYVSIAKTHTETAALYLIGEYAESLGSSVTDGLRGI